MTPKEKANELVDKYEYFVRMYNDDTPRKDMQKQCALIAVFEIFEVVPDIELWEYFVEVKQEIELL